MKQSTPTPRYERKYLVRHVPLALVRQIVAQHPASFRQLYPDRQINNIYFDTPDFTTYRANVVGTGMRKKFRVRWYGDDFWNLQQATLEIKHRSNQTGTKDFFDLDPFDWQQLPELTATVNRLTRNGGLLQPMLLTHYHRAYLGTGDGKFRLTIDTAQHFMGVRNFHFHETLRSARRFRRAPDFVVLELKYDAPHDDDAQRILQYLPFRQTKSSKYVNGVELVYG